MNKYIKLSILLIILFCHGCLKTNFIQTNKIITSYNTTYINSGNITCDTLWSGTIIINGDVTFTQNTTLKILPGTTIKFIKLIPGSKEDLYDKHPNFLGAEIIINGKIYAIGTSDKNINFIGPKLGSVNLLDAIDAKFEFCNFIGLERGIHSSNSKTFVQSSGFKNNNIGIGFRLGEVKLYNNLFINNNTGIRFHDSSPNIEYNNISNNKIGIFISSETKDVKFKNNNFTKNINYNISLSEDVTSSLDARNNFWGTKNTKEIENNFYDFNKSSYLGKVIYYPFETGLIICH